MFPTKLQHGQNFKTAVVQKINELIDYLKTQRISGDNKNIKVSQFSNGIGLSINIPSTGKSSSKELNYPFKLSIEKNSENVSCLSIKQGRVQVNYNFQQRSYISFYQNNKIPLTNLQANKTYAVILLVYFNHTGSLQPIGDNRFFYSTVYFVDSSITVNNIPCVNGIYPIVLGSISVENINGENIYNIIDQRVFGDYVIEAKSCQNIFSVTPQPNITSFSLGAVKNSYTLDDFNFFINQGYLQLSNGTKLTVNFQQIDLQGNLNYIYCVYNSNSNTLTYSCQTQQKNFYDQTTNSYYYQVAKVNYSNDTGLKIQQSLFETIYFAGDTYKVKTIEDDIQPGYLSGKIVFHQPANPQSQQTGIKSYLNAYIGADLISANATETGISGTQYNIKPIWLYKEIPSYDSAKFQYLINNNGNLLWSTSGQTPTSGQFYKVATTSSDNQPDYLYNKIQSDGTILSEVDDNKVLLTLNTDLFTSNDDSVDINYDPTQVQLDLSARKVSVDVDDEAPDYLANKLQSSDDSIEFTAGGTLDMSAKKVAATSIDNSPDYLDSKIVIDSSLQSFIEIDTNNPTYLSIKLIQPSVDSVLGYKNGSLQWIPLGQCQQE